MNRKLILATLVLIASYSLTQAQENDLERRIDALTQRVDQLEAQITLLSTPPESMFQQARRLFTQEDYQKARSLFKFFLDRYPEHQRAEDAQYYIGASLYRQKEYDSSIREFQKAITRYPESSLADDALYRAGEAAERLKQCSEARAYFGLLRQKYPKSSLFEGARQKDEQLRQRRSDKSKCDR